MQRGSVPLLVAAATAFAVAPWYVFLIASQGRDDLLAPRVWFVALYILGGGVLAAFGALARRQRGYTSAAACGALVFVGGIGLFSIGMPLLLASVLAAFGTGRVLSGAGQTGSSRATALAVALLVIGVGVAGLFASQP